MKKTLALIFALNSAIFAYSQDSSAVIPPTVNDTIPETIDSLPVRDPNDLIEENEREDRARSRAAINPIDPTGRTKDHLLIQLGYDAWANKPDSINTKSFARSFSMYFMFDFPFKTNPKLSVGIGAGISTGSMYFKDTYIDISGRTTDRLAFTDVADTTRFKKFKLMTTFLEAPVELRYTADPSLPKKSFKAALGIKVGTMLGASTKGKILQNGSGQTINAFVQKEKAKRFFNTTRISVAGRVGLGNISLFGSYQVNAFVKEGLGPDIRPFSIGITLSGL